MTNATHHWIKRIEPILREELNLESKGWIPEFDFAPLSAHLSKALYLEGLTITSGTREWKSAEHIRLGFGTNPSVFTFECPLIKGPLYWITAERDVDRVTEWLEKGTFLSKELKKGLYEYALLEGLDALQRVPRFKPFSCQITEKHLPEQGALYSIDISLQYQEEILWCRLAMSKDALMSIENHFAMGDITIRSLETFPHLPLDLYLSAGFVRLTETQFSSLRVGDFVMLDQFYYRPKSQKGSFQLAINDTQLFQVKIKEDQMKILDFTYDVEEPPVDNKPPFDDEDDEDDDEEIEEPSFEEDDEDDDDDFEEDVQKVDDAPKVQKMKLKDVPLTIHVEVKRLKMTLEELHKLSPGQSIPLSSAGPLNLVHLTLQGQVVAEGELLELGENIIGVKLSKIYR